METITVSGVGECEAWHEGFMPWLLELPALKGLRWRTQKTVRWPGYAAKVTVLREMGLLSQKPVTVDGVPVVPKRLLDELLYPRVRLEEGERDITVFRVEALGEKDGRPRRYRVDMDGAAGRRLAGAVAPRLRWHPSGAAAARTGAAARWQRP